MWDYLEHIAFVLSNIVKVLRVMPQSEAKLLRRSFTRRYTTSLKQRPTKAPHTKSKPVPFVTGDDGKLLPGVYVICVHFCLWVSFSVIHIHMNTFIKFPPLPLPPSGLLLYLCDCILPLLKSYYAAFFNPTMRTSDQDRKMQISSDILAALLVSCRQSWSRGVKVLAAPPFLLKGICFIVSSSNNNSKITHFECERNN